MDPMREILFHGKRLDNGEWVEGAYFPKSDPYPATIFHGKHNSLGDYVDPATVGQYIGRQDKNGKKIFEGHVVEHAGKLYVIEYIEKYSRFAATNPEIVFAGFDFGACEIVGNIHDNPDLLQKTDYLKNLQALSVQERQRILYGEWGKGGSP